jgi:hypothetical protein
MPVRPAIIAARPLLRPSESASIRLRSRRALPLDPERAPEGNGIEADAVRHSLVIAAAEECLRGGLRPGGRSSERCGRRTGSLFESVSTV